MAAPSNISTKNAASNKVLAGQWSGQNIAKTKWMVIEVSRNNAGIGPAVVSEYTYKYSIYYNDNSLDTSGDIGKDLVSFILGSTQAWRDGHARSEGSYKKAVALLKEFKTDPESKYNQAENAAPINIDTPLTSTQIEKVQFNPIPHRATRSPSFYTMANIEQKLKKVGVHVSGNSRLTDAASVLNSYETFPSLGKIYQTESTAKALASRYLGKLAGKQQHAGDAQTSSFINGLKTGSSYWGFRFTYNPTTISYSNQVDTSIDWQLNVQDPSRFFGGNVTISFDLYLNRIADLSSITGPNSIVTGNQVKLNSDNYPGYDIKDEDINGIYYRGTDYDLEFLYRCVNGDPGKTSLTQESLKTSDFGYITGSPLWLHLHDNLRYKASLTNISVDHVLFSERMVPMLSVVRLSFIRYPELESFGDTEEARLEALKYFNNNSQGNDSSNATPPGKTG